MWWSFNAKYPERSSESIDNGTYDYIVVGGGTAGCVLASRLSEDPNTTVLLLERGIANDTWMSHVPIITFNILDPTYGAVSWRSEPMKFCEDRQSLIFRGEVLGGTSRINGLLYTRGATADYDLWRALGTGHPEWSYEKLLPYFSKSETTLTNPNSPYRGSTGPWINQTIPYLSWPYKAYHSFQQCAEAMGFRLIPDMSSPEAPCDGLVTVDAIVNRKKKRVSTFDAFLPRQLALERVKNLTICSGATVSRVGFSSTGPKPRAEKVFFQPKNSTSTKIFSAKVNREVIICSGALGSPQILMLSGIGPRQHLQEHGIEVVHDLPGVGSDLSDHLGLPIAWEVPLAESLTNIVTSPLKIAIEFLRYVLFGTGLLSMPVQALALLVRGTSIDNDTSELVANAPSHRMPNDTQPEDFIPDIEIMPLNTNSIDEIQENQRSLKKVGVFSMLATLLRPKSRGSVQLRSSNPHDKPRVDFGFLSNPEDYIMARKAIRLSLKLGAAMKDKGFPLLRGLSVPKSATDDKELDETIRHYARTTYHYSGTCRMAAEMEKEAPGVVDDQLRVYGVEGVRVCDASIFPTIMATHLMAPVVMVAEKCADMIKASEEEGI